MHAEFEFILSDAFGIVTAGYSQSASSVIEMAYWSEMAYKGSYSEVSQMQLDCQRQLFDAGLKFILDIKRGPASEGTRLEIWRRDKPAKINDK